MKKLIYILSLILLAGCVGPVKSSWNDFRAHYNIHYNAKKSFRAGLKQVEEQPVTINPDEPVRVHRKPNEAGNEYFAQTIDKEAHLLRKFPDTKWADDALFLIGKSYYYRKEFYLALQKFEELYALDSDPQLKQQAVIWKGRTLLDLGRPQDAIIYLENELAILEDIWSSPLKAEARVLLTEHYAMVANWESAADYLNNSFYAIKDKPFLGRTFFLHGQILEHLKHYREAFLAYDQVSANFPDYEYVYWANIKKGQVAREEGNIDLALSVFNSMKSDDKNFERLSELNFEIARTQELKGNIDVAERMYGRMLHTETSPLSRDIQAKVYYRLGEIFSKQHQNFKAAAAYYDSSSMQVSNTSLISEDENAGTLASAYSRYTSLKQEVSKIDSLLWLGSLPASELDSVIEKVREEKRHKLQQQVNDKENSADRILTNIEQVNNTQENQSTSQYGFLNYRNQNLAADSKSKFQAVWGRRPLVDNWRRVEAVARMDSFGREDQREAPPMEQYSAGGEEQQHNIQLNIDLSEIPTTKEERRELTRRRAETQYELGSLFFLTLDLPDSAASYFRQIVRDPPPGELKVKSMYSLFELHHLLEQEDSSRFWGKRVLQDYPNTVYAERVNQRMDARSDIHTGTDSSEVLLAEVLAIEDAPDSVSLSSRAEKLRALALDNRTSKLAPYIHYRAIRNYVQLAKKHMDSGRYVQFWQSEMLTDRGPKDSLAHRTKVEEGSRIGPEPLLSGPYWNSVRTMLEEYDTVFAAAPHRKQLRELDKVLAKHDEKERDLKTCRELGITPEVKPDMDTFLSYVTVSESVQNMSLPKEINYRLIIKNDGSVISYQLESKSEWPDLEKAYGKALEEHLQFLPFREDNNLSEIRCLVSFPVRRL